MKYFKTKGKTSHSCTYGHFSTRKITYLLLTIFLSCSTGIFAQDSPGLISRTPSFAIKTNVLYDATTTFNIGIEQKLSSNYSLEISGNYNPWTFGDNNKIKHLLVQPEIRYWFCESFNGTFVGLHAHWAKFNISGLNFNDYTKDHRFQGWLAGGGFTVGHHWILSNRFSIEASIGVGYAFLDYETYPCTKCGEVIKDKTKHYIGPTKAGLSLIYIIK